jgi:type VI secretion system lysozyme-like protein
MVANALRRNLEKYEPRLAAVEVEHLQGEVWDQRLRFSIKAQLIVGRNRERVSFETRIDPTRRITVT